MSIVTPLNRTVNTNLALETVSAAAKSYFHAPNQNVRNELLVVIEEALPECYVRYTTPQGVIVERLDDRIEPPRVHLHVEQTARSRSCPVCRMDLLQQGEIVDVCSDGGAVIMCANCQQFWRVKEGELRG